MTWLRRRAFWILLLFFISGFVLVKTMETSIQPISGEWKKMFRAPAAELTDYAKEHPLVLRNKRIENEDISKSQFYGANFRNVEWNDVVAQEGLFDGATFETGIIFDTSFALSTLRNVKFENVKFGEASFSKGILENVLFDNCMISSSSFVGTKLQGVTFRNCKIYNSEIRNLRDSAFRIENCEFKDTNFFQSKMDLQIIKSKGLEGLDFGEAFPGSTILIRDSYIGPYSAFSKAEFDSFVVESSRLEKVDAGDMKVREVRLKDTEARIDFGGGQYQNMVFDNTKYAVLWESTIGTLLIENFKPGERIDMEKVKAGKVDIRNSTINTALLEDATINELHLVNVRIGDLDLRNAKIRKLVLQNVTVTKKADFSQLLVDEPIVHGFHADPGVELITTGSSLKTEQLR